MLADFPLVPARLGQRRRTDDPLTLSAGSGYEAHWEVPPLRAHLGGPGRPADRRLRRAASAARPSAPTASTRSPRSVPTCCREWDAAANAPLRPDRIKATYDKAVTWHCRATRAPALPDVALARAKVTVGCRFCRQRRRTVARREKKQAA